ncbi:MAG: hypothetical protein ACREUL_20215 [Steroidobacteraceae bacterium]
MTSPSARSAGSSITDVVHRGEASAGPFMLTLCRLAEPVSIRPPQSQHLKSFTFFTSRARRQDGSEPLYLHMGFFETLAYAERWARAVRGRHPDAIATIAPPVFWQSPDSGGPACRSADPLGGALESQRFAPVDNVSLTDTQVLDILERRRPSPAQNGGDAPVDEQIELLRPDDTGIRRALKEAVVKGAPVSFAVQLRWSARPIDPGFAPSLDMFKAYTLYAVESRGASRSCFFLRLGFFGDPVSAKQVAAHVRSSFASAAVVPVLDEEITRAREACMDTSLTPCLVQQRLEPGGAPGWATASKPENGRRRSASQGAETLEQTLAQLAEREMWNDPDLLSDTGVRHLKVEIQRRSSGRH